MDGIKSCKSMSRGFVNALLFNHKPKFFMKQRREIIKINRNIIVIH